MNDRIAAAKLVAEKLTACEHAIDEALISAAELTTAGPMAQRRAKLSAVVGQNAIALTGEALAALLCARAKMIEAHHAFAEVRDQIGLRTFAGGDLWKIPTSATADNVEVLRAA